MRTAWDIKLLKEYVGEDNATLRSLLADYLVATDQARTSLEAAINADNTGAVAELAHKLKSSSRWVGALALGEICETLEIRGTRGDLAGIRALQGAFEMEVEALRAEITAAINELI